MTRLSLRTSNVDRQVHVDLAGELDLSNVLQLEQVLRRLEREDPDVIVLDLGELKFIDSTGLRLVIGASMRAKRGGWRLKIVEGEDAVRRIFRLTGVDRRLDIVGSGAAD